MWRLSNEFLDLDATPLVLRVTMPVNFIIHLQALSVDVGGVALRAYRTGQGAVGGSFDTPVTMYSVNFMDEMAAYTFQGRSEEHTSELQSLMRISYAVFCLKKTKKIINIQTRH